MGLNPVTLSLWTHTPAVAKLRLQPSAYICGNIAFLCLQPKPLRVSRGSSWPTEAGVSRWKSRHRRGKHLHQHHLVLGSPYDVPHGRGTEERYLVPDGLLPSSHLYACLWLCPCLKLKHIHSLHPRCFLGSGWSFPMKLNFCLTLYAF